MMEVDGTNSQSTRGTKRKDMGKPDGNDSSEEPDDGEPNKKGNKNKCCDRIYYLFYSTILVIHNFPTFLFVNNIHERS